LNITDIEMTFRVFQYDAAGDMHDTNKEFSITLKESNNHRANGGYSSLAKIDTYGILMTMFAKVYGFTLQSGYNLTWIQPMMEGDIGWRGSDWHIRRVR
jgi:hypothetical protein